ncbi:MAG: PEGA domain-containing protein [Deltaproteobacteria bacterium]|nr:PEGA domain-containing protein [Deltaproteobacteria bacterium]
MKRLIALLLVLVITGCSTFVTIRTEPEEAKIYINDEPKGKTPFTGKLENGVFQHYIYRIEAPGYKPLYGELSMEFKWGPFIGGWFFLWPMWLWASGPRAFYSLELEQAK